MILSTKKEQNNSWCAKVSRKHGSSQEMLSIFSRMGKAERKFFKYTFWGNTFRFIEKNRKDSASVPTDLSASFP